ncbi:hypothetical protein CB1_000365065 [Camelus ferus]|nr:hypothetical protein CB1_000365065 [Camelus ferus]
MLLARVSEDHKPGSSPPAWAAQEQAPRRVAVGAGKPGALAWKCRGMCLVTSDYGLGHISHTHANDCKNIANIMKTLAYRGFIFKQTSKPF